MRIAKGVGLLGLLAMGGSLVYGFRKGNFREEGKEIVSMPWGIVSLVDVYVGFTLFSGWIVYRERSLVRSIPWVASTLILGNFASSLYTLVALQRSGGDWKRFWMGRGWEDRAPDVQRDC